MIFFCLQEWREAINLIQIKQLNKHYKTATGNITALKDINLSVVRGQIYGVIGKSGAGKSSLIRCINLLETPDSGSISINNVEITKLKGEQLRQERRKIGMIFQHFNLLSSKTVFDNVALPLRLAKVDKQTIKTKVDHLLKITGLDNKHNVYPAKLSGGQKQRVAIARALANDPEVLLCDEATSALDPHTTNNILKLLHDINQTLDLTILLITHEMSVIKDICDQVAVLDHGEIIEQGSVLDIFTHPKHEISKSLIHTALRLEVPEVIKQSLQSEVTTDHHPLIRLTFVGNETDQPFLSHATEQLKVKFNILQANIELIHQQTVGVMLVQAFADQQQLKQILTLAKQQHIQTEVLGYVR